MSHVILSLYMVCGTTLALKVVGGSTELKMSQKIVEQEMVARTVHRKMGQIYFYDAPQY
jgi:hypothetical protein